MSEQIHKYMGGRGEKYGFVSSRYFQAFKNNVPTLCVGTYFNCCLKDSGGPWHSIHPDTEEHESVLLVQNCACSATVVL